MGSKKKKAPKKQSKLETLRIILEVLAYIASIIAVIHELLRS